MNTINNERAMRKSKAQICSALMILLQTKPYRRITVSLICISAVVSLLRKWIESGYRQTPEQMGELASKLIDGYDDLLSKDAELKVENVRNESISDILNNIPTGVCVLFMPDETHQEVRFANTQQIHAAER